MARKYFGTDGVRGQVGKHPITPDFVMHLGYAAGKVLTRHADKQVERPSVLIGKDTRISGYMLESALEAGLIAAGIDVLLAGPVPTPAVAYLTRALRLQAGIVISASHNPYPDNGIKFFSAQGSKLPDSVEIEIEQLLDQPMVTRPSHELGKARRIDDASGRYVEFCKSTFPSSFDLHGVKLVVDAAHGACYQIAAHVFHELGAEVISIGSSPDGLNINDNVGATCPQAVQQQVLTHHADLGIALDGDGDRLLMVDSAGNPYDGDQLLYIIARNRQLNGELQGGVIGTLMTNYALEQRFSQLKIPFQRAKVGDRYVIEQLIANGWQIGGENSGHLLCLDKHSTGDGIISALQVLSALQARQETLQQASAELSLFPQVMKNIRTEQADEVMQQEGLKNSVASVEERLSGSGRVLLRPSGTEPVIRVMVEHADRQIAEQCVDEIIASV